MKKFLFLLLVLYSKANAQSADGAMDCTVTGNVVVASEEGKFNTYSHIQGGVKVNEKLIFSYTVRNKSIYFALKRMQADKNVIISSYLSADDAEVTAERGQGGGFILSEARYNHGVSFLPDYIRIKEFREFFISRYYKNDWHGIFSAVHNSDATTQTLTLNCRHTNDKMDAAFKIFNGYKERK